jgi:PAS domain S-box-containing protein
VETIKQDNAIIIDSINPSEEKFRDLAERYHALFNQAPLGILLIDPETMIAVEFNDLANEQLGYSKEEFAKLRISDYQAVESVAEIKKRIQGILEEGQGSFQTKHCSKTGSVKDILVGVQVIELTGKKLLLCTYLDITQKQAVEYALMEIESKYRLLVEMAQEGVWALDSNNNTVYVNPRLASMLGCAESEVIGKSFAEFVKREMEFQADLEQCAKGESTHCEFSLVRKDGKRLYANIAASPISDDNGNRIGTIALVADVTERKKAEEKLRESNDRMQIMTEKLRVVGGLTRHDVRNKLSGINIRAYSLRKRHSDVPDVVSEIGKIEQSIRDIARIFDFARMYEQLGVENLTYIDMKKVFDEAVALFPTLNLKIENECQGLSLLADSLLRQMFYNFIDNTGKYGKKATTIKVRFETIEEDSLRLIYEDDGVGINAESKLKLFREGFSSGGGTGFGLFLSKKTVDLYGWQIQEVGKPGRGVKFVITIPRLNKKSQLNYQVVKKA